MVTSNHDDLDAGGTALGDRVGHRGPGRIDHRHQAYEAESVDWEVEIVGIEFEANRELVGRQCVITEAEHSFAESAQFQVRVVKRLLHLFVENLRRDIEEFKNRKRRGRRGGKGRDKVDKDRQVDKVLKK